MDFEYRLVIVVLQFSVSNDNDLANFLHLLQQDTLPKIYFGFEVAYIHAKCNEH